MSITDSNKLISEIGSLMLVSKQANIACMCLERCFTTL